MTTRDPGRWGVTTGYADAAGSWHAAAPETVEAVLDELGATAADPPEPQRHLLTRCDRALDAPWPGILHLEDGGTREVADTIPAGLPLGYHRLEGAGEERMVIVSPGRCPLPRLRAWGWAVQLYAARSRASWGIGDLADLRGTAEWSRELGAGLLLVNPLHAAAPLSGANASPYYPSSRRFRNPLYLRIEEVPGAARLGERLEVLTRRGRALNASRRIDRDAVLAIKQEALEAIWSALSFTGGPGAGFTAYRREQGRPLATWATWCVLAERHGRRFTEWPEQYRRPGTPAVERFAADHADRVAFHAWQQWLLDEQLRRASALMPTMQDLAIGVDPTGADAWEWQDALAHGFSVGAPPDEFNTRGQNWALPPFDPWRLRAHGYAPFIETVRAGLRHAGGLRFDHVMGLFRLFWIPAGAGAGDGVYVHYPAGDLLDILALESTRAGAFVVGEDLGTIEPHVRDELAARDILSYRLLWFEPGSPATYPERALSAVTTHDLPTVAGLWTGSDLRDQEQLGLSPNVAGTAAIVERLGQATGCAPEAPAAEVTVRAHQLLGQAPSLLLTATLDDAAGVAERPNMPGTTDEWPNWSIALPVPLEDLQVAALPRSIADALRRDTERGQGTEAAAATTSGRGAGLGDPPPRGG